MKKITKALIIICILILPNFSLADETWWVTRGEKCVKKTFSEGSPSKWVEAGQLQIIPGFEQFVSGGLYMCSMTGNDKVVAFTQTYDQCETVVKGWEKLNSTD